MSDPMWQIQGLKVRIVDVPALGSGNCKRFCLSFKSYDPHNPKMPRRHKILGPIWNNQRGPSAWHFQAFADLVNLKMRENIPTS